MAHVIVIPARLASERLPGKVLLDETGWPLIRHVYERCHTAPGVDRVVVAADSRRVLDAVNEFGGEGVLTEPDLASGTDRVAQATAELGLDRDRDLVVNVQGDEPRIDPLHVERLFAVLKGSEGTDVATLVTGRHDLEGFRDPNRVKVVVDQDGFAMYFSRATIPFPRDRGLGVTPAEKDRERGNATEGGPAWLYHIGAYGFRIPALERFRQCAPTPLELCERLEQLRFLEVGLRIRVGKVEGAAAGIDTAEDYRRFVSLFRRGEERLGS